MSYGYFTNTNRLKYVYDTANDVNSKLGDLHYNPAGKDTINTPDYAYDGDGNLTADKNKGIRWIHYNFLNLPDTVSMTKTDGSSKGNIVYRYDAQGTKWAKIVTDSTASPVKVTTTLYLKGFQYINDTIQFVAHEEVRTRYFWQHYLNGDSSFRLVAESDSQTKRQQQGKDENPEHDFGLALQFQHARHQEMGVARPAAVAALGRWSHGLSSDWSFLGYAHADPLLRSRAGAPRTRRPGLHNRGTHSRDYCSDFGSDRFVGDFLSSSDTSSVHSRECRPCRRE